MTTTTERIANAIKPILEEDRRADRERIAELERDLNSARALIANQKAHNLDLRATDEELRATIDDLNRQIDEAHKENARLVMAHAEKCKIIDALTDKENAVAPVVEEQGPWVIRTALGKYESRDKWRLAQGPDEAMQFAAKEDAEKHIDGFDPGVWGESHKPFQVLTVAEARAIEAKRG